MTPSLITPHYPLFLAGKWKETIYRSDVRNPYTDTLVGTVSYAGRSDIEEAVCSALTTAATARALPAHKRAAILLRISTTIQEQAEEFARTIAQEAAKPIRQARAEVERSIFTFRVAAEEAARIPGEVINLDATVAGEGRRGIVWRVPVGPVVAITPFNFPLNLVAHKLAPAIAAGCPVILKPASQTPITALKLARIIAATDWPIGALSVLPMPGARATPLVEDARVKLVSFTGSPAVGWALKARAGRARVILELGGNAGMILHHDADVERAVARIIMGGFSHAGQSCISVQRIVVHRHIYDEFLARLIPAVEALVVGNPLSETSDLSSVISAADGTRIAQWLDEATAAGATIMTGGHVEGAVVTPTVLANAAPHLRVNCQEVFAPVVTVQPYEHFEEALAIVNASDFGLQAGVFTNDIALIWKAYETLDVGGVIINDVPTWRVDQMPYGGMKQSGFGREGIKYAIEEMTEPKLLVFG